MVKRNVSVCGGLLVVALATVASAQQPRVVVRNNMAGNNIGTVVVDVKPAQLVLQRGYETRTDAHIREIIHQDRKAVTEEERKLIDEHWRRTERLWRIRHLAENASDTVSVGKCDALIKRADEILDLQIKRFRDRAPVVTVQVKP